MAERRGNSCFGVKTQAITDVHSLRVTAYVEQFGRERSAPTVEQHLAAIHHLFGGLVTGWVMLGDPTGLGARAAL
jgi:hypothetical protein